MNACARDMLWCADAFVGFSGGRIGSLLRHAHDRHYPELGRSQCAAKTSLAIASRSVGHRSLTACLTGGLPFVIRRMATILNVLSVRYGEGVLQDNASQMLACGQEGKFWPTPIDHCLRAESGHRNREIRISEINVRYRGMISNDRRNTLSSTSRWSVFRWFKEFVAVSVWRREQRCGIAGSAVSH